MKADEVIPHICNNTDPARCSKPDHPGACENCGKPIEEHPSVDVSNTDRFFLCQDRAMKWARVEPGTVIPAGQPFRIEWNGTNSEIKASERQLESDRVVEGPQDFFIDSSWKPPLVLPTEPTWGIAVHRKYGQIVSQWWMDAGDDFNHNGGSYRAHNIVAFIPLTDEQVARIEAAR